MKREPVAPSWPVFDSRPLGEVSSAFLRRRKAIAYQAGLTCARDFTESADRVMQCLSLSARNLRLAVWEDGGLWVGAFVRARGRNAGWAFRDVFNGDMLDVSAETLVGMFEGSLSLCYWPEEEGRRDRLRKIWSRVNPRPV